jgi:hypothetical protein
VAAFDIRDDAVTDRRYVPDMICKNPGCCAGRRNRAVALVRQPDGGIPVCAACVCAFSDRRDAGDDDVKIVWLFG